jgi:replication-associated recombination protein RarA
MVRDYKYAPDYTDEELKDEEYLPDKLKGRKYIK